MWVPAARNRPLEETAASPTRPQPVEGGLIAVRLARLAGPRVEEQALGFLDAWLGPKG